MSLLCLLLLLLREETVLKQSAERDGPAGGSVDALQPASPAFLLGLCVQGANVNGSLQTAADSSWPNWPKA